MTDDELPEPTRESWDVDAMWERVHARTFEGAREPVMSYPGPRRSTNTARLLGIAASFIVTVGAGALLVRAGMKRGEPTAAIPAEYSTARGQYATVHLTDSSEVTLAPESRLVISARFAEGVREISLEGEAVFNVRHDATRPFKVTAGGAVIEDIGTRFDVRAYKNDRALIVAVAEGSVALGHVRRDSTHSSVVLKRGDVGTIDSLGNASAQPGARASGYLAWASGTLSFVDRPLPEVLRTISRWYDVDVRVTDSTLARRLVNAEFSRSASVSAMVGELAIAMDARIERAGRVITLRPR
jgi:ferric-dicitrate binding protein FerR (iron transport regulator)